MYYKGDYLSKELKQMVDDLDENAYYFLTFDEISKCEMPCYFGTRDQVLAQIEEDRANSLAPDLEDIGICE